MSSQTVSIEDEILNIVATYPSSEYPRMIEERKNAQLFYHLSPFRENLVEWIPFRKEDKILEIGCECGAITGVLLNKAGSVTCVEENEKCAHICRIRHRNAENLTVYTGEWKQVEEFLSDDYDYILLVGTFGHAPKMVGGKRPYQDLLTGLKRHVNKQGRILIAMNNQFGLTYFAGSPQDSSGVYFAGIENHESLDKSTRSFGRSGLEKLFYQCGILKTKFYYPYPNYKYPMSIYSDVYLPSKGELSINERNFERNRLVLFDEKSAFDAILEDGTFPIFANAYFVVIGEDFPAKYVKYSNDRAKEYAIRTQIVQDVVEGTAVHKVPMDPLGEEHIRQMASAYESLLHRYAGSDLLINPCVLVEREGKLCASFDFEEGVPLSQLMDQRLEQNDIDGFYELFSEYVKRIGYRDEIPAADYDTIFSNIMVSGSRWTLIDYEWTFAKAIPIRESAYRAAYCYILEDEKRAKLDMHRLLRELSVSSREAREYREMEDQFQKFVTGNHRSLSELRTMFGHQLIRPIPWLSTHDDPAHVKRVQIYTDVGEGYSEASSYFVTDAFVDEDTCEFEIEVADNVKVLRIDPCMAACMVKVDRLEWNGKALPLHNKHKVVLNGAVGRGGFCYFESSDPNINIRFDRLQGRDGGRLKVSFKVILIPPAVAGALGSAN
ncbi:MAG: class I SAM-dependent methyltransferase [Clostridium sp.]|jgi:hypothetical protein|nr:class I SAM-dependent methyltransferase [Clostridium sp.]